MEEIAVHPMHCVQIPSAPTHVRVTRATWGMDSPVRVRQVRKLAFILMTCATLQPNKIFCESKLYGEYSGSLNVI